MKSIAFWLLLVSLGAYITAPELNRAPKALDVVKKTHNVYPKTLGMAETIGENLISNGRSMKIIHFETLDPIVTVLSFYQEQWKMKGMEIRKNRFGEMSILTGFEGREPVKTHSVIAYRSDRSHSTQVFVSVSQKVADHSKNIKRQIPKIPNAEIISEQYHTDLNGTNEFFIQTTKQTQDRTLNFYRNNMMNLGWKEVFGAEIKRLTPDLLTFQKGDSLCIIQSKTADTFDGTLVLVQMMTSSEQKF